MKALSRLWQLSFPFLCCCWLVETKKASSLRRGEQREETVQAASNSAFVRRQQAITQQCWEDSLAEKKGIFSGHCEAIAGSPSEDFLLFMTEQVLPSLDILGSILDPKVKIDAGSSCLCQFNIQVKADKLIQSLLKSRLNPCYVSGERDSDRFSTRKAQSSLRVLGVVERVLDNMSRMPIIKVYARKLRTAVNSFANGYRGATKPLLDRCVEFNHRAIQAMDEASRLMDDLRESHETVMMIANGLVDFACLVQGSGQSRRHRRTLWHMNRILRAESAAGRLVSSPGASNTTGTGQEHRYGRLLAFNPVQIDTSGLEQVLASAQAMSSRLCEIAGEFEEEIRSLEATFQAIDSAMEPVVGLGIFIDTVVDPVATVFAEVVDELDFLRCPGWLGFLCDLDSLIVGIVEKILAAFGLDVNKIINDIVGLVVGDLPSAATLNNYLDVPLAFNLQLALGDLGKIIDGIKINPFMGAFDESGRTDTFVSGNVGIEFRLASGADTVTVRCEEGLGLLPVTLGASRTTSCDPNYQFTSALPFPCDFCFEGTADCAGWTPECTVNVVGQGLTPSCELENDPFSFLSSGPLAYTNIVYTCLNRTQYDAIETLPVVFSTPFAVGDTKVPNDYVAFDCTEGRTAEPVGLEHFRYYEYVNAISEVSVFKAMACDGLNPSISEMLERFGSACGGGSEDCGVAVLERCFRDEDRENFLRGKYVCRPNLDLEGDGLDALISYHANDCRTILDRSVVVSTDDNSMMVQRNETELILSPQISTVSDDEMGFYQPNISFVPTESNRNVTLECPSGRALYVLRVTSGSSGGIAEFDPYYSDDTELFVSRCQGLQTCSLEYYCPVGFSGFQVYQAEYECLCEPGHELLPPSDISFPTRADCTPCGPGKYRSRLMDECTPCPVGQYNDVDTSDVCLPCNAGTYASSIGSSSCIECPPGTFGPELIILEDARDSPDFCRECPLHTFSSNRSSTECVPCPAGQKTTGMGSSECVLVDPGEFNDGITGPRNCTLGTFSTFPGSTACEKCPVGSFAYLEGAVGCKNCSSASIGACALCPPSTYADEEGSITCIPCGGGAYTLSAGAVSVNDCIAPSTGIINYNDPIYTDFTFEQLLRVDLVVASTLNVSALIQRRLQQKGNGICNFGPWNTKQGEWDGGDCCPQSCSTPETTEVEDQFISKYTCTPDMFSSCLDPKYAHLPAITCPRSPNDTPRVFTVPNASTNSPKGDGICNEDLNVAPDYDDGDCCAETCTINPAFPFQSCLVFSCSGFSENVAFRNIPAELVCPPSVTKGTDEGECFASLPDTTFPLLSGEYCGVESYGWLDPPANLAIGNTTLIYQAILPNELSTPVCELQFLVEDREKPSITCPADKIVCDTAIPLDLPILSDNCDDDISATLDPIDNGALVLGENTLTYRVTDKAGNSNTCSWNVVVVEDCACVDEAVKPSITCPPDMTTFSTVIPSDLPTVSDNCDNDLVASFISAGAETLSIGTNTLTYTVTDRAGNTNTCTRIVMVQEQSADRSGGTSASVPYLFPFFIVFWRFMLS